MKACICLEQIRTEQYTDFVTKMLRSSKDIII